ncbi:MAG: hypothetical protein WC119_00310 [Synergistaceae bacterium]
MESPLKLLLIELKTDVMKTFPFLERGVAFFKTSLWKWIKRTMIAIFIWLFLWVNLITHIEPTEAGIGINWFNGNLQLLDRSGWHVTPPWVWVCKIETTPMRVSVSTASRGYSSKLIQFNKEFYKEFVETEGWYFYWWYNRLSFNIGYDRNEEYRGFRDIMRAYAYSAKKYQFITTLKEYED